MTDPMLRAVDVVRVRSGERASEVDRAAAEEPLEIRLHDRPFVVIMRTPGADRELAAGFLLAERIITGSDDLGTIAHCTDPSAEHRDNIVNVRLTDVARAEQALSGRRHVAATASCGVCGRRSIDDLTEDVAPLETDMTVDAAVLAALPEQLRRAQAAFEATGGVHAAGLFASDGSPVTIAEDIGRHNAVDKVVGRMLLRDALPLSDTVLCVSGRTSFEIVQKAMLAGIPIVAAVSAPSSLAIELADRAGVTLVGFVRGESFNIYAHGDRVL